MFSEYFKYHKTLVEPVSVFSEQGQGKNKQMFVVNKQALRGICVTTDL